MFETRGGPKKHTHTDDSTEGHLTTDTPAYTSDPLITIARPNVPYTVMTAVSPVICSCFGISTSALYFSDRRFTASPPVPMIRPIMLEGTATVSRAMVCTPANAGSNFLRPGLLSSSWQAQWYTFLVVMVPRDANTPRCHTRRPGPKTASYLGVQGQRRNELLAIQRG